MRLSELGDGALTSGEVTQDLPAGGVGQRVKYAIKVVRD